MESANDSSQQVHKLIIALEQGEAGALDKLVEAIYPDLKRLAHFQLSRERPNHTLNTTEIVHEAFLRISSGNQGWSSRRHFLRAAAIVMRHLLVDHARKRQSSKHGSGAVHLTLHEDSYRSEPDDHLAVLALNDAINDIEKNDPVLGQIIECRCFAGLSMQETAEALGMPKRTVERDWQRARGYIAAAMEDRNA